MVNWDVFVQLNCFLKLNCTTTAEDIKFICKIFDPEKKKIVERTKFNEILNMLFGGGIKYKSDEVHEEADQIIDKFKKGILSNVDTKLNKFGLAKVKNMEEEKEIDHLEGTKGYAQDIKRDLLDKGLFDEVGDFKVK